MCFKKFHILSYLLVILVGSVIIISDNISEIEKMLVETSASFISKYLEA